MCCVKKTFTLLFAHSDFGFLFFSTPTYLIISLFNGKLLNAKEIIQCFFSFFALKLGFSFATRKKRKKQKRRELCFDFKLRNSKTDL